MADTFSKLANSELIVSQLHFVSLASKMHVFSSDDSLFSPPG